MMMMRRKSSMRPSPLTGNIGQQKQDLQKSISAMDETLKRLQQVAEQHKDAAPKVPLKEVPFAAMAAQKDPSGNALKIEPEVKSRIDNLVKMFQQAGTIASDLQSQFGSLTDSEESHEQWFRRKQRQQWHRHLIKENKIEISRVAPGPGQKTGCFTTQMPGVVAGTVLQALKEGGRVSKHAVVATYEGLKMTSPLTVVAPPDAETQVNPVAIFKSPSHIYVVCNLHTKPDNSRVALFRVDAKTMTHDEAYGYKAIDGLFEKGLQAVHMLLDDKQAYLLVRGLAGNEDTGHGIAVIATATGMVDRWIALPAGETPSQQVAYYRISSAKLQVEGRVTLLTASSVKYSSKCISLQVDLTSGGTPKFDAKISDILNEYDEVTEASGFSSRLVSRVRFVNKDVMLGVLKLNHEYGRPPQCLIGSRWTGGHITLPEPIQLNSMSPELVGVGSYIEGQNCDFLIMTLAH